MAKRTESFLNNKAFSFKVVSYNPKTQEYTLYNKHTEQTKIIPKKEYFDLVKENEDRRKRKPI